ncbi:uncharacterized protein LOC112511356 [Cynara cardunculus var. scolymus]|uniref:uncharacterized protein LOC112511356 n=1 Tax=Cynara cardunculus var. scolymus TaxID=59895 RepID=UPI000D62BBEF|nr:uncharacterized protein LOC112511356 [Cynara cardunculus var. scolymus]
MEEDFLKLEQGNRTVREYTERFTEHSRFAEHYIAFETRKVERYIWGLKPSIREFVIGMSAATFPLVVDAAEMIDRNKNRQGEEKVIEKRKWEGSWTGFPRAKVCNNREPSYSTFVERACPRCRRVQQGDFNMDQTKCYQCGESGHLSRNCPTLRRCFQCNSPGHIKPNCPQLRAPRLTMGGNAPSTRGRLEEMLPVLVEDRICKKEDR